MSTSLILFETCTDRQWSTCAPRRRPRSTALAETFKVLGDVTRVRILDAISRSELCVGDIAELLGLSESAVSHQLRLLRSMRLVRPRRDGQMIFYTLDDQHIVRLFEQGLEHVQESGRGRPTRVTMATCAVCELHAESTFKVEGMDCREEVALHRAALQDTCRAWRTSPPT